MPIGLIKMSCGIESIGEQRSLYKDLSKKNSLGFLKEEDGLVVLFPWVVKDPNLLTSPLRL
jgi:hypothetical protein